MPTLNESDETRILGRRATLDELLQLATELVGETVGQLVNLRPIANTDAERVALAQSRTNLLAAVEFIDRLRSRL